MSYKEKLVFHLGVNAGFFSEYNNMILTMLFCLERRIRFVLYSKDANFGFERGWRDFFVPFTAESTLTFHSRYNCRSAAVFEQSFDPKTRNRVELLKRLTRTQLLTHDVFEAARARAKESKSYKIPELGIDGDVQVACSTMVRATWRFNSRTEREVNALTGSIRLPDQFVGIHVRSGDKPSESKSYDLADYIRVAERVTDIRSAFVATDDYTNVEQFREPFPRWTFYHLCQPTSRGYHQTNFNTLTKVEKKPQLIELFASVEMLCKGRAFVGTFTSNVGMYVGMRRPKGSHGVDSNDWFVW